MSIDLKPCPFCGSTPTISKHPSRSFGETWQIGCDNIDCPVESGTCGYVGHNGEATAISKWNTRYEAAKAPAPDQTLQVGSQNFTSAAPGQPDESSDCNFALAITTAALNQKSLLEMLEVHIVDYPTPYNIDMQRFYLAALKEEEKLLATKRESVALKTVAEHPKAAHLPLSVIRHVLEAAEVPYVD